MVTDKKTRTYEVSIWTLQDSFIAVLKPLNLEFKGIIQDGKITLKDDGENSLFFSIPMYIRKEDKQVENPLWIHKQNGNLIANLRKIKVIFNKYTNDEQVFEFIITKVTETHDGFSKMCEVTCEGLAFNELGKQGYKINLSADNLYGEAADAAEAGESTIINNNINYWVDKVLAGSNWKYSIQMDWSSYDGINDYSAKEYAALTESIRNDRNTTRENANLRRRDKIYEDAYVSSWRESNGKIIPNSIQGESEKLRIVEGNESNRYNLLQNIAETFGVYTKYKYYYDNNYHIIGREVIFYNNFLNEDEVIDLNYYYDTQNITRELDAADVVTKMFINTLDDESSPSGIVSIVDTEANKTGEDYILNFDYLHDIGTISEEQYAAIAEFENKIGILNKQIIPLDNKIIKLEEELLECEVKRDNALLEKQSAEENIADIDEFLNNVMDGKNELHVIDSNPAHLILTRNSNGSYKGRFETQYSGIFPDTIKVYRTYNSNIIKLKSTDPSPLSNEITDFGQNKTKNSKAVKSLTFKSNIFSGFSSQDYFFVTFDYRPALEKEEIKKEYIKLANKQDELYKKMVTKIEGTNPTKVNGNKKELGLINYIKAQKAYRKTLYDQKNTLISNFENMMGPALREGNWTPEDDYASYGETHIETFKPSFSIASINGDSGILRLFWDNDLFEDETKNYYTSGILQTKVYYPCIDLTKIHTNIFNALQSKEFLSALNFTYKDNNSIYATTNILPIGSCCELAFIRAKSGGNVIPVLMITDLTNVEDITNESSSTQALNKIRQEFTNCCISYVSVDDILTLNPVIDNETIFAVPPDSWVDNPYLYDIVYPRFEVNSNYLKTGTNELFLSIFRENTNYFVSLEEYTNYYILNKDSQTYITIKPESLFLGQVGKEKIQVNFSISNTALQIYLDGINIMKENAYPKVSYNVSNLLSKNLIYNTYDRLGQLAHINDYELKLDNVMGYISSVDLNLDSPWEDSIIIQNYKNKFEDLFSNIVAQTESMQQNSYKIGVAINSFSSDGKLTCELDDLSLLSSAQVLNRLIKNNADVINAKITSTVAKNKALLTSTDTYRVMHGEVGLQFQGNNIRAVTLNKDNGLLIEGFDQTAVNSAGKKTPIFFNLTNERMGFYRGEYSTFVDDCDTYNNNPTNFITNHGYIPEPLLSFKDGDLALLGTIYAKNGWFGGERGWIIGSGLTANDIGKLTYVDSLGNKITTTVSNDDLGGLLFSANGKVIFTSGTNSTTPKIILSKTGFPNLTTTNGKADALFLFDGNNLYINGVITAAAGNIGGWIIGSHYLGDKTTQLLSTIGMASAKDDSEQTQRFSFWAGGAYNATPKFSVAPNGYLTSTSGKIGGWKIGSNWLGSGDSRGGSKVGMTVSDNDATLAFWAGATSTSGTTVSGYTFGVTQAGALTSTSGKIANWNITKFQLYSGSGSNYVALNSGAKNTDNTSENYNLYGDYAIWAGASDPTSTSSPPKFSVTKAGILSAKSAIISGTLTAGAGSNIGGWYIGSNYIGSAENRGTSKVGMSVNSSSNTAFAFWAGGVQSGTSTTTLDVNQTAFSVTQAGSLIAQKGTIGGWTINSKRLYNKVTINEDNTDKNYFAGLKVDGTYVLSIGADADEDTKWNTAPFRVTHKGKVYATGAEISGQIKATSGTIGENASTKINIGTDTTNASIYSGTHNSLTSTNNGFYLGANGLSIGSKVSIANNGTITATDVDLTGKITASSGRIGGSSGWYIESGYLGNASTLANSTVGMYQSTTSTDIVFWAGNKTRTSAPFRVTAGGALTATSVTIGSTSNTYLTYDSTNGLKVKGDITAESGTFTGTIKAKSGTIGENATNKITIGTNTTNASIYSGMSTRDNTTNNGFYLGTDGLALGKGAFKVTNTGALTATSADITGTINASSGQIGQLRISQNQLYYAEQNKFIGIFPNRDDYVFAIGGKLTSINTNTGDISFSDLVFKVTGAGKLYATGADISGKITATSGAVGGWVLSTSSLASAIPSDLTNGIRHRLSNTSSIALSIGAPVYAVDTVIDGTTYTAGTGKWSQAPFRVSNTGVLTATSANLASAKITGTTTINTDGAITLTSSKFTLKDDNTKTKMIIASYANEPDSTYYTLNVYDKTSKRYGLLEIDNGAITLGLSTNTETLTHCGLSLTASDKTTILSGSTVYVTSSNANVIADNTVNINATNFIVDSDYFIFRPAKGGNYNLPARVLMYNGWPSASALPDDATGILLIKPTSTVAHTSTITVEGTQYSYSWYSCNIYYAQPYENVGGAG